MYKIMGKYQGYTEEIDETDSKSEAEFLKSEYQIAFGSGWLIWIKKG